MSDGESDNTSLEPPATPTTEPDETDGVEDPLGAGVDERARSRRRGRHPRSKRRRWVVRSTIGIVVLIVVLVGSAVGYAIYRNDQIHHISVANIDPKTGSIENILLIGSTSRCALNSKQGGAFGLCSNGVTGVNSDVVMVLRLNGFTHRVSVLSFPRDTFLPNARPGETNRIDSALYVGPGQLVKVIEDDFGIPINHFVELNFDTFQSIVKSLNGIQMYFPNEVKDPDSGLKVLQTGCVRIGAFQALAVVRARHMSYLEGNVWQYDPTGDIGRIIRDHEFLRVLAGAVAKRGIGNPLTDNALIGDLAPDLTVDNGFSLSEMVSLLLAYRGVSPGSVPETTLPVVEDPNAYYYKGYNYGDVVFPVQPQDQDAVAAFLGGSVPGTRLPARGVSVSIIGGTGNPSATTTVAAGLSSVGFKVTGTTEHAPVGPIAETQVLYAGPATLRQAERVAASLIGPVAVGVGAPIDGAQVTVVTGTNLRVRHARSSSTGASGVATTSADASVPIPATLSAAGFSSTSVLSPPIASSVPLPPYDPRACPARSR